MKRILLLTLQFILLFGCPLDMQAQKTQTKVYTCPMHPEVKMDKPGSCPKCGMTLVETTIKMGQQKTIPKTQAQLREPGDTVPTYKEMEAMHDMHGKTDIDHSETDAVNQIGGEVIVNPGKTVRYDLYVTDTMVNYTGKQRHGLAVNGSIPAPPLVFTEGDTAEIYLHNRLKMETSIHWHGVILPNEQDGVPFLTTSVIPGGTTHLYKFKISQNGTYWYHSHSGLQQQIGTYGALIFKSREENAMNGSGNEMMKMNKSYTAELPMVLSDWTDEHPHQVQRRLRSANDWYAIKKGSVQSYAEAIGKGYFTTKLANEWRRMNAMDVSDVYYENFFEQWQA